MSKTPGIRCSVCGRYLTSKWAEMGMGPKCYAKAQRLLAIEAAKADETKEAADVGRR